MTEKLPVSTKRSFLFKLLSLLLLIFAVLGWLRFSQSIYQWYYLVAYQVKPGPLYTLISGLLIGISMSIGLVAFWMRKPWSKQYLQIAFAIIFTGWWLDYLILTRNPSAFTNWPFRLVGSLVVLGFIYGYLQMAYPRKKRE
jgi:hypothetical protein